MSNSSDAGMTPDQLAEAKQYGRIELLCGVADKAIDLLFLAAAILLARPLDHWLQTFPWLRSNWSLRLVASFLVVTALHIAVSFPLSFYSGFRVGAAIPTQHASPGLVAFGAPPSGICWPRASARR